MADTLADLLDAALVERNEQRWKTIAFVNRHEIADALRHRIATLQAQAPEPAKRVPTSREVMIAGGVDPDAPFEVGPFPQELRQREEQGFFYVEWTGVPCPFCGELGVSGKSPEGHFFAGCPDPDCLAHNLAYDFVTVDHARAAWDNRTAVTAPEPTPARAVEPVAWMYHHPTTGERDFSFSRETTRAVRLRDECGWTETPLIPANQEAQAEEG